VQTDAGLHHDRCKEGVTKASFKTKAERAVEAVITKTKNLKGREERRIIIVHMISNRPLNFVWRQPVTASPAGEI